jgi:hypothetical protein
VEVFFGDNVWDVDWDVMVCFQLDGVLDSMTSRRFGATGGVSCKEKDRFMEDFLHQCCA